MSQLCSDCDCADKSQCKKKTEMLEPIIVYSDSDNSGPSDLFFGGGGFDREIDYGSGGDYVENNLFSSGKNLSESLAKQLEKVTGDLAKNFKKDHSRSYEKAKQLFEQSMKNPELKLSAAKKRAIQDAINLDKLNDLKSVANRFASHFKFVERVNDIAGLGKAIQDSLNQNSWNPVFQFTTKAGVEYAISAGAAFIISGIPGLGLVGSILLLTAAGYIAGEVANSISGFIF